MESQKCKSIAAGKSYRITANRIAIPEMEYNIKM
jgi:hypothetical protein